MKRYYTEKKKLVELQNRVSRPFEGAIIDHCCLDILVNCPDRQGVRKRPWLTLLLDYYSRRVLGFDLSLNTPTYVSNIMVLRECVKKYSRIPDYLVKIRARDFESLHFDSLLKRTGCTAMTFPTNRGEFNHFNCCDNLISTVNNFIKGVAQFEVSFENLRKLLSMLLFEIYEQTPHQELGTSPRISFETVVQRLDTNDKKNIRYDKKFKLLTCPTVERKIISGRGIMINYCYYWTNAFADSSISRREIKVKYDPKNIDEAFAYINGNWEKLTRRQVSN